MGKITEGVTCLSCKSVIFSINGLIEHMIDEPSHKWFKFGEGDGVLFIKLLKEVEK